MSTVAEGAEMARIFSKYYNEREVDIKADKETLDKLVMAAYIKYTYKDDGKIYAQASEMGKRLIYSAPEYIPPNPSPLTF
jgi:hypothetical protein